MRPKTRKLIEDKRIEEDHEARVFIVKGSEDNRYTVVYSPLRGKTTCTCPAGQFDTPCYHREAARAMMTHGRKKADYGRV